ELFLRWFERTGDRFYLEHVLLTLRKLRESKTFDARGGGFFRYSSGRDWQQPHPEKLLADQAGLLSNYVHAFALSKDQGLRETAEGLVSYMDGVLSEPGQAPFFGCEDFVRPPGGGHNGPMVSYIDRFMYCDANALA